jgi:glycosyltransferase involved in cell wall biosynthesis
MPVNIFYVCGGRSFRSDNLRPKIEGIVNCWRQSGHKVDVICGGDFSQAEGAYQAGTANAQSPQKWYRELKILSPLKNSISEKRDIDNDKLMQARLELMTSQNKPDIIWERNSRLHCAGLEVARKIGVSYVLEWRDHLIPYSISLYHHKAVRMEKYKNQQADYIVVESQKLKEDLAKEGIDKQKILIAHNAVNPQTFRIDTAASREYRKTLGISDDEILVGYLGSYSHYHDMTRLVLAADILSRQSQAKIRVLMVGKGRDYEKLHKLATNLQLLGSTLIMKPWVPKEAVPRVLSALDIAVLAGSTDIICPIKVQEYMAMERAVVLPDYPCNREVVTDGKTGILFEPKNEKALAEKLLLLAKDSQLRGRLGKAARQEILQRFTWEKTWRKALQEIIFRTGG